MSNSQNQQQGGNPASPANLQSPGQANANPAPMSKGGNILGIGTDGLAGLSVDEVVGNKVAVTMVMHYYKQLVDENASMKNDLNTARTYVMGYDRKSTYTKVAAWLQALGAVGVDSRAILTHRFHPILTHPC
ncbi:hypothetical protein J7U46_17660 [Pelomonas sp. V22]|uniref:hypothetical protein n=1 Tax=Pelomonas sp. V22 TaxID=2822139 RepID=UPI0024A88970|nr:hypothetical protein [Pelomonas sp. V22]MDI4634892.1 hypothetical protein [Pelomonas sp. V22]